MKIVPVIKSSDLERSLHFYTEFWTLSVSGPDMKTARWPTESLTYFETEPSCSFPVMQETVSSVPSTVCLWKTLMSAYATFHTRGLDTTLRPESPIHTAPVNQTWGCGNSR